MLAHIVRKILCFIFFLLCFIGDKYHNGIRSAYGLRFDKSKTLIGVRLDMWRGTLEFFHNRNPLGKSNTLCR